MSNHTLRPLVTTLRILYPVWAVVGMFSLIYVPSRIFLKDDLGTTGNNIQNLSGLFHLGILGSLTTQLIFIVTAWYLFRLFRETNLPAAQLMLMLALVSVPMAMLNELFTLTMPLYTDQPDQLRLLVNLHKYGLQIVMLFWGLWLFPLGYLISHSGYFPRAVGWLAILGGAGYTLGFLLKLLAPEASALLQVCEYLTMGEVLWLLWLIVAGARLPAQSVSG